ncbi:hypothetical protein J1N35_034171 [Gossypium stocksii]|uniref:Retrovirus-related Pol polyprotein from transposon TNT 1-94-like beta-barrel domain-containing protein n=1 Tax=Gossypium stocksii TaxID=47602 RepID=A0A9D3ZP03_9ROSI|nr:hypothetical protein J1N35_034171 [Gossypium stocksii]
MSVYILHERRETLICCRHKLSFEDVKGHFLSKDKLNNEFGLDSKANRQASVLVASKKQDKREIKGVLGKSNKKYVANANLADKNGDDFLLVSTIVSFELMSKWILDSGCSFHMCPNKEWFSTYNSVESGVICIGNVSYGKVIGIGTIKIRMHNEKIRTILDVRPVASFDKDGVVEIRGFGV